MIDFLLQASSNTEAFTRLQQTLGLIAVNIGTVVATSVIILKFANDLRSSLKQARETARELLDSKKEIVEATQRNYQAIEKNTAITENQVVSIQRHILKGVQTQFIPISQRLSKIEAHLFSDEEDGNAPTTAWKRDEDEQL